VSETVQNIRRKLSVEAQILAESLDGLSNSSSLMLAYSRTTEERLKDVQSEISALSAEIRDMKNMLRDLSANSSVSSTHKGSKEPIQPFGRSPKKREMNPAHKNDTTAPKKVETDYTLTQHSTTSNPDQRYEPEFEILLRATKYFIQTVQQLYHPLIAEYISPVNAWRTLQLQLRCLAMEMPREHWSGGTDVAAGKKKTQKMNRAAASQLLSLRKACF
jgi:hypothetical protein